MGISRKVHGNPIALATEHMGMVWKLKGDSIELERGSNGHTLMR